VTSRQIKIAKAKREVFPVLVKHCAMNIYESVEVFLTLALNECGLASYPMLFATTEVTTQKNWIEW
jgi:hypothetical protein